MATADSHERPGCGEGKTPGTCANGCYGRSVWRRGSAEAAAPPTPVEVGLPAWKKKALALEGSSDPHAAPFGGSWREEASVDATAPVTATPSP